MERISDLRWEMGILENLNSYAGEGRNISEQESLFPIEFYQQFHYYSIEFRRE